MPFVEYMSRGKSGESTLTHVMPSLEAQSKQALSNHLMFLTSRANLSLRSVAFMKLSRVFAELCVSWREEAGRGRNRCLT